MENTPPPTTEDSDAVTMGVSLSLHSCIYINSEDVLELFWYD